MQSQINSIEYQLTPEQAEQLAFEATAIRNDRFNERLRWTLPILFAVVAIYLGLIIVAPILNGMVSLISMFSLTVHVGTSEPESSSFFSSKKFLTLVAVIFSAGIGFIMGKWWWSRICRRIKQHGQESVSRFGTARSVMWNEKSITFNMPMWQSTIHWPVFKRFVIGKTGVHFLSDYRKVVFSIPKSALPPNLSADELVSSWSKLIQQTVPPIIKP